MRGLSDGLDARAGTFVTKLFHGEIELIVLEGLFDDGDRAVGENAAKHFAVGVTGDDHNREVGVDQLQLAVNFVTGDVREFEVEEDEIESLLFSDRDGFSA